jgi:hypothetical protein
MPHVQLVRRRPIIGLLGLVTLLHAAAATRGDTFHGINAGAPVWGGNVLITAQQAQRLAATGTKSLRVNFRLDSGATTWNSSQLAMYDQVVQNARDAGLTILGLWSNETTSGVRSAGMMTPTWMA